MNDAKIKLEQNEFPLPNEYNPCEKQDLNERKMQL